jgi:hypothetical protein
MFRAALTGLVVASTSYRGVRLSAFRILVNGTSKLVVVAIGWTVEQGEAAGAITGEVSQWLP